MESYRRPRRHHFSSLGLLPPRCSVLMARARLHTHIRTYIARPVEPCQLDHSWQPFAFDPQGQLHQFLAGLNAERTRPLKLYPRTAKLEDARRQRGCDAALSPPAKVGGLALSVVRARRVEETSQQHKHDDDAGHAYCVRIEDFSIQIFYRMSQMRKTKYMLRNHGTDRAISS